MAVQVRIPVLLRSLTGGKGDVEVSAGSVQQIIDELESQFPGMKERLYDEQGSLRRFINIYVNSEDIRSKDGDQTAVSDGDEISIVPAIAGGR